MNSQISSYNTQKVEASKSKRTLNLSIGENNVVIHTKVPQKNGNKHTYQKSSTNFSNFISSTKNHMSKSIPKSAQISTHQNAINSNRETKIYNTMIQNTDFSQYINTNQDQRELVTENQKETHLTSPSYKIKMNESLNKRHLRDLFNFKLGFQEVPGIKSLIPTAKTPNKGRNSNSNSHSITKNTIIKNIKTDKSNTTANTKTHTPSLSPFTLNRSITSKEVTKLEKFKFLLNDLLEDNSTKENTLNEIQMVHNKYLFNSTSNNLNTNKDLSIGEIINTEPAYNSHFDNENVKYENKILRNKIEEMDKKLKKIKTENDSLKGYIQNKTKEFTNFQKTMKKIQSELNELKSKKNSNQNANNIQASPQKNEKDFYDSVNISGSYSQNIKKSKTIKNESDLNSFSNNFNNIPKFKQTRKEMLITDLSDQLNENLESNHKKSNSVFVIMNNFTNVTKNSKKNSKQNIIDLKVNEESLSVGSNQNISFENSKSVLKSKINSQQHSRKSSENSQKGLEKLNFQNLPRMNFNDEFLENLEEFSPSWREGCRKVKLI